MMMLNLLFFSYRLTYEQLEHSFDFDRIATEHDVITLTSCFDDDDEFAQVSDV